MAQRSRRTKAVIEYGDFQTPLVLARSAVKLLARLGFRPHSVLEPTCGRGTFVAAVAEVFSDATTIIGVDINKGYLASAFEAFGKEYPRIRLICGDFFDFNWESVVTPALAPWLIVGNPPWVTSSALSAIESVNVPAKSNFYGRLGIEAITGKSNFDISEWMLLRYLDWLQHTGGVIAVLCKTIVARKILQHVWKSRAFGVYSASAYKFDTARYFDATVDACLFILELRPDAISTHCDFYENFESGLPTYSLGYSKGHVVSDIVAFNKHAELFGRDERITWRSGIKHDCSKVMELRAVPGGFENGLGEYVHMEDALLYPLLKSSDVGNGRVNSRNVMLVTQDHIGADTNWIRHEWPQTWEYLTGHAGLLNKRASVIYKNRPVFSIFGVGSYAFAPWKVAISGFYKKLEFLQVGPENGKPVVFDDTVYFLPCVSADQATFLARLLRSEVAQSFLGSMIHWDDKRPITIDVLKRLSLEKLAAFLGESSAFRRLMIDTS